MKKSGVIAGFRTSLPLGIIAACLLATAPQAQEQQVSSFADWGVYTISAASECWVATTPLAISTTPGSPLRSGIYLMFTYRPDTGGVAEMSYAHGAALDKSSSLSLTAPLGSFDLFAQGGWAWPKDTPDDRSIVSALEHADLMGLEITVQVATDATESTDRFSAKGFSRALAEASRLCPP